MRNCMFVCMFFNRNEFDNAGAPNISGGSQQFAARNMIRSVAVFVPFCFVRFASSPTFVFVCSRLFFFHVSLVLCLVLSLRSTFPFFDRSLATNMRGTAQ